MAKIKASNKPIGVFFSYAQNDEKMRDELAKRLKLLEREQVIASWHDRKITPGTNWEIQLDQNLNSARIILLLISPDFLASDYCYGKEGRIALERHQSGDACVIPVILRPCDEWKVTPLGGLQALPKNGKAVTLWRLRDLGYQDIARGIREAIRDLKLGVTPSFSAEQTSPSGIPILLKKESQKKQKLKKQFPANHRNNPEAYPFKWIDQRRKEALAKTWVGTVSPLVEFPDMPKQISVTFKFKSTWKVVKGFFYFDSFKPGIKGKITNHFQGGFYSDHILRIDYVHADKKRFGFGALFLSLSGDSFAMEGFTTGFSSNYDKLFASKISLRPRR